MLIGLISEPKTFTIRILFKRLLGIRIRDAICNFDNPFNMIVEVVPYSRKDIEKMSPARLTRILKKQQLRLQKMGAERVVVSIALKKICIDKKIPVNDFSEVEGNKLFLRLVPVCIRQLSQKYDIDLLNKIVCIRDKEMDRISEYLMRALCFDVKNLIISTHNIGYANIVCEGFFDETGFLVKTTRDNCKRADIVIDVDACEVKLGRDLYIRNAELGYTFNGYNVSHTDTALCLSKFEANQIKWIYDYKSNA